MFKVSKNFKRLVEIAKKNSGYKESKPNKYHSDKTFINNTLYDSKKESVRSLELQNLQRLGIIRDLKTQVPIIIQDSFTIEDSTKKQGYRTIRAIKYIADFTYYDTRIEKNVIEDTKGFKTKDYLLKYKLILKMIHDKKLDVMFLES